MGIHDGHRSRVFEKFEKNGFVGLNEHEKLEIILFFSIPRPDTNEIAHRLLDKYKTIANVMDAPVYELEKFPHVTNRTAYLFKMIKETASLYEIEKCIDKKYMTVPEEFGTFFQLSLANSTVEKMMAITLDSRGRVLDKGIIISEGDVSGVGVNARALMELVLRSKATEVVIAHNHPGNIAFPSQDDIEATKRIKDILASVGVILKDHFIVTDDDYCSMASVDGLNKLFE